MAELDDIQRTLIRIERLMANAAPSTGAGTSGRRPQVGRGQPPPGNNQNSRTFIATTSAIATLGDGADTLRDKFSSLSKTVHSTRVGLIAMNQAVRTTTRGVQPTVYPPGSPGGPPLPPDNNQGQTGLIDRLLNAFTRRYPPRPPTPPTPPNPGGHPPSNGPSLDDLQSFSLSKTILTAAFFTLAKSIRPVINDFFDLHRVGINGSAALTGMYLDAARAGMSLHEYTTMLQESSNAVVRFSDMRSFSDAMKSTTMQLAEMGVHTNEADKLSAALASSAVSVGIPLDRIEGAMNGQVKIFGQLRKASLTTADAFQELAAGVANNSDVQAELLGLSAQQRAARLTELVQTQTLGLTMGMTKQASKELGDALIAQRKASAVQRFQGAGRLQQAAAIVGMDSQKAQQLGALYRNKRKTPEETALFAQMLAEVNSGLAKMGESGSFGLEHIEDVMRANLDGAGAGDLVRKAGAITAATDAGQAGVNADLLKEGASTLSVAAGQLLKYADGLKQNPIGAAVSSIFGSTAFSIGFGAMLAKFISKHSGPTPPMPTPPGSAGIMATIKKIINGAISALTTGIGKIGSMFGSVTGIIQKGVGKIINFISAPFRIGAGTAVFADLKKFSNFVITSFSNFGATFQNGTKKIADIMVNTAGWFKGMFGRATGIFTDALSKGRAIFTTISQFVESSGGILKVLSKGAGIFGKMLKAIPAIGNIISFFIDAVGEVFTGNIAAAFNAGGGGWLERIGGVVFASINGLLGGVWGLVDSAIKFFGGEGFNLENAWDKFAIVMKAGLMLSLAKIVKAIPVVGDKASAYFEESANSSFAILDKLQNNEKATVASIGREQNEKLAAQKENAKQVEDVSKKAIIASTSAVETIKAGAGIITSTKSVAVEVQNKAKEINARYTAKAQPAVAASAPSAEAAVTVAPVAPAAVMLASPGQTVRPAVTQPIVNTPTVNTSATKSISNASDTLRELSASNGPVSLEMLTAQFTTMIDLLTQSLAAERAQVSLAEALALKSGRTAFSDTESMINRVTRYS